ncbi:uncharacterized protein LOC123677167 [Harmonia axyridis]|uniref:uncharacterized protein LOC123677167 n=1 Tax=Harmonia axyridis TaxID=115357 RepID=UPI001E279D44|nr:uncharacterized protein LOC123677167 [Harmonia axyridis]
MGVLFDSDLSFVSRIEEICASFCRSLGFLFRSFREFDDLSALRGVFFSLVVSKLNYANLIWFPIYVMFRKTGRYPERGTDLSGSMEEMEISIFLARQTLQGAKFVQKLLSGRIDCRFLLSWCREW